MYPADLKYTKDHEWIRLTGSDAEVGITDYAQRQLGDVVYVELPDVGTLTPNSQVKVGDIAVGTVTEINAVDWHAEAVLSLEPNVELPANSVASVRTSDRRLAAGHTRFTRPMRSASSAVTWRPVRMMSSATPLPTSRDSRCVPP